MPRVSGITTSRKEEITTDFLQLMEQHIDDLIHGRTDHRFSAADFAQRLFIHSRHLTNTIRTVTGRSPCDFMETRLLEETQKLLRETTLSIADTGARFGWHDPSNFTKWFRNMSGMTPIQYRKSLLTPAA